MCNCQTNFAIFLTTSLKSRNLLNDWVLTSRTPYILLLETVIQLWLISILVLRLRVTIPLLFPASVNHFYLWIALMHTFWWWPVVIHVSFIKWFYTSVVSQAANSLHTVLMPTVKLSVRDWSHEACAPVTGRFYLTPCILFALMLGHSSNAWWKIFKTLQQICRAGYSVQ